MCLISFPLPTWPVHCRLNIIFMASFLTEAGFQNGNISLACEPLFHELFVRDELQWKCYFYQALSFSAVNRDGKKITAAKPRKISCTFSGLSGPAEVKWIKPGGKEVKTNDSRNYAVDDGKDKFVEERGLQITELTLKAPVVENIRSDLTYKCSVKSREFPEAPVFSTDVFIGGLRQFP